MPGVRADTFLRIGDGRRWHDGPGRRWAAELPAVIRFKTLRELASTTSVPRSRDDPVERRFLRDIGDGLVPWRSPRFFRLASAMDDIEGTALGAAPSFTSSPPPGAKRQRDQWRGRRRASRPAYAGNAAPTAFEAQGSSSGNSSRGMDGWRPPRQSRGGIRSSTRRCRNPHHAHRPNRASRRLVSGKRRRPCPAT